MGGPIWLLLLFLVLSSSSKGQSWAWFSSSTASTSGDRHSGGSKENLKESGAEFSMEVLYDPKAVELVENARRKLGGSNPCWLKAYQNLFASCSEIFAAEEKRSRLAWHLGDCFQRDTGRSPFPSCGEKSTMIDCLRKLNNDDHKTYLEFYLETNSICHQLQSKAFKFQVESLVNELKRSSEFAEQKLESIEEKSDNLLRSSNEINESLMSVDVQTRQMGDTLKSMQEYINSVLRHSKELYEQAKGIASSQAELLEGQGKMREELAEDMKKVEDSYTHLGKEIDTLQNKAVEIEKQISKFEEELFSSMKHLQGKADDIANMTDISLDKQQELVDGQSRAHEGLQTMIKFQSQALEESRDTLKQLLEFADGERKKLLEQQKQLLQSHDHLYESSKSILAAQEAFESKQSSMFAALDKLFALHNALLIESKLIKAVFFYSLMIFFLYIFTGAKETYAVRFKLYIVLCIPFFLEFAVLRLTSYEIQQQTRMTSIIRLLYITYAVIQLLYSYFTFRDYETLNYQMLVTLMEKVNGMEKGEEFCWDGDMESDVDWLSWVDTELPEDVDDCEDPDFRIPEEIVGENSIVATTERRYNLRRRQ
ncbi:hypothetical protein Ancab_027933 [Ancistrocladus abbreviatus]